MLTILLFLSLFGSPHKVTGPVEHKIYYSGNLKQGGLVEIQAPEGSELELDGEEVKAYGDKYFIGFGRDASPRSILTVTFPDDFERDYPLSIEQRNYQSQAINNVDPVINKPTAIQGRVIEKEAFEIGLARHMANNDCPGYFNFIRPAPGKITAVFGSQRVYNGSLGKPHSGIDFAGAVGDPAYAPEAGKIIFVEDMVLTGKTMAIDHGCGVVSTFMHLSAAEKNVGDTVKKGEIVARIGRTGVVTGPHLHWSLNLRSIRLDPLLVLK